MVTEHKNQKNLRRSVVEWKQVKRGASWNEVKIDVSNVMKCPTLMTKLKGYHIEKESKSMVISSVGVKT